MKKDEKDYLWQHFVFNAEQRLKAFNFFVIFSVFANGGVFTAFKENFEGYVFVLIGGFICVLSIVFGLIDIRSQFLLRLAVPGLKEYEKQLATESRLFTIDASKGNCRPRYTLAFRILFILQFIFGLGIMIYGLSK
jgi:hypothetical protein